MINKKALCFFYFFLCVVINLSSILWIYFLSHIGFLYRSQTKHEKKRNKKKERRKHETQKKKHKEHLDLC